MGLASMMATTMYLWFRSTAVRDQFKSAVLISGLVTFIAAYHYFRIFNSWVEAYHYSVGKEDPVLTGATFNVKSKTLGVGSALMIVSGYYGELTVTGDLTP